MLTSSDAKWKCLRYMLVWSIQLALGSWFFQINDHVTFFLWAGFGVIALPAFTAKYSNSAGQRYAKLLRVGLVLLDPVLSCLAVTPVLLLNYLPIILEQMICLRSSASLNDTLNCTESGNQIQLFGRHVTSENISSYTTSQVLQIKQIEFSAVQASVIIPMVMVLLMWRRTAKMSMTLYMTVFAYWFIVAVESGSMLEVLLISDPGVDKCKSVIFTTQAITCIAMIFMNTYALVTFCSFVNPRSTVRHTQEEFHFVYIVLMCGSGIAFAEIPMFAARVHVMATKPVMLPGSFYLWLTKDVIFVCVIAMLSSAQWLAQRQSRLSCKPSFDNTHVFFQPEKRDRYICECRQAKLMQTLRDDVTAATAVADAAPELGLTKFKSEPNILSYEHSEHVSQLPSSKSTTCLDDAPLHTPPPTAATQTQQADEFSTVTSNQITKTPKKLVSKTAKKDRKQQVSFKLLLGNGQVAEFKARSDSPPVIRDSNESAL